MKKVMTFAIAFGFVLHLSAGTTYAYQGRGRGQGQGPVATGRSPSSNPPAKVERRVEKREDTERNPRQTQERKENKFEDRIEQNPALRAKVGSLLPAGANLRTAASGFKNQGQFIAALHVSRNLGIPFNQLKAKVTGPRAMSLGNAIQELKPNMSEKDVREAARRAERQAKDTENPKPNI